MFTLLLLGPCRFCSRRALLFVTGTRHDVFLRFCVHLRILRDISQKDAYQLGPKEYQQIHHILKLDSNSSVKRTKKQRTRISYLETLGCGSLQQVIKITLQKTRKSVGPQRKHDDDNPTAITVHLEPVNSPKMFTFHILQLRLRLEGAPRQNSLDWL